jgi:hypothetical protein
MAVLWSETKIAAVSSNFGWYTHGAMRASSLGIYTSSVGGAIVAWNDSRNLMHGADPRETGWSDRHGGFGGFQTGTWNPSDITTTSCTPLLAQPVPVRSGGT